MSTTTDSAIAVVNPLLSIQEIKGNTSIIQQLMLGAMRDKVDFGLIPGCGSKPTLLKAGSEKILSMFRLAVDPVVEDMSTPDCIRYRVQARILHMESGRFLGAGLGECSSDEEKYKWRAAVSPQEYADADAVGRARLKHYRSGVPAQQVRTNPADIANTVLKMAKKRAQIDATLTVTAASDMFTQDIEDMNIEPPLMMADSHGNMVPLPPKAAAPQPSPIQQITPRPAAPKPGTESVFIASIEERKSSKGDAFLVITSNTGQRYSLWDIPCFPAAHANVGRTLTLGIKVDAKGYKSIVSGLEPIEEQA